MMNIKTKKQIAAFIAIMFLSMFLLGALSWSIINNNRQPKNMDDIVAIDEDGNRLANGKAYRMSANMIFTGGAGIMSIPQSVTLIADITPVTVGNKKVDWSVSWVNTSSDWATGKTVTDFVAAAPTSDGALTAEISCLQPFGEQIKITVTSRSYPDITAECVVDYMERVENVIFNMSSVDSNEEPLSTFNIAGTEHYVLVGEIAYYVDGVQKVSLPYTIADDVEVTFTYSGTDEMLDYLATFGIVKTYKTFSDSSFWVDELVFDGIDGYYNASSEGETNAMIVAARENLSVPYLKLVVTATGEFNILTKEVYFYASEGVFPEGLVDVELDNQAVFF